MAATARLSRWGEGASAVSGPSLVAKSTPYPAGTVVAPYPAPSSGSNRPASGRFRELPSHRTREEFVSRRGGDRRVWNARLAIRGGRPLGGRAEIRSP